MPELKRKSNLHVFECEKVQWVIANTVILIEILIENYSVIPTVILILTLSESIVIDTFSFNKYWL